MLEVDIVTPSRRLEEGLKASSIKLPSSEGEIEILPGHAELLTLLSTGIMTVSSQGGERKFAVSFGFAEVRQDKVRVLAETVEEASEINKLRAQSAQKKAEEALSGSLTEEKFKKHQAKLRRSIIRQQIAG